LGLSGGGDPAVWSSRLFILGTSISDL